MATSSASAIHSRRSSASTASGFRSPLHSLSNSVNLTHLAAALDDGWGATGTIGAKPDYSEAKIVVAMVGLPARGKSYLSNKLMRYLRVSKERLGSAVHMAKS